MSADLDTSLLTNLVLTQLRTVQLNLSELLKVGDMSTPAGVGWTDNTPNAPGAQFTPYIVVLPLTATPAPQTGSLADSQGDWHIPFRIDTFGVNREQVQMVAFLARGGLAVMKHEILDLGSLNYRVQQVYTQSIGGVNRVPLTDPPYFGQTDQATLWLAKRRS